MRKVIFTEEQVKKYILGEGVDIFAPKTAEPDQPENAYGTEVSVNNLDKDADPDVTITDNPSHKRVRSNRLFARSRNVSEAQFDDARSQNFGKNEKEGIVSLANNGGGKMVVNLAADIQNGGARNNTNQVRASRLEKQKKEDPVTFAKNGGKETLKALKSSTTKESNKQNVTSPKFDDAITQVPNVQKGTGKKHQSNEEGNIYYY